MPSTTDAPEIISTGHAFLEGPRWHDGDLYASDFFAHRVLRWRGGEGPPETVCAAPQQSSGLDWTPDGQLLAPDALPLHDLPVRRGRRARAARERHASRARLRARRRPAVSPSPRMTTETTSGAA